MLQPGRKRLTSSMCIRSAVWRSLADGILAARSPCQVEHARSPKDARMFCLLVLGMAALTAALPRSE